MAMIPSFQFNAQQPGSYEEMQRRRAIALALSKGVYQNQPRNAVEGVGAVAEALASRWNSKKATDMEQQGRKQASEQFNSMIAQNGMNPEEFQGVDNPFMSDSQKSVVEAMIGKKFAKPEKPDFEVFYDEETGREYKGIYDPETGQIKRVGGLKAQQAGTTVNNVLPGAPAYDSDELRKKLDAKEGEAWSGYLDQAVISGGMVRDMEVLDELSKMAPQGPITGRLAQAFPGFDSAGAAYQSIVKRIAPSMRAEGSGSTSDIEYAGFLQSLPALQNRPEANMLISQTLQAKAQIDIQRAEIVQQYQNGDLPLPEARKAMRELDRQSILTPELKAMIEGVGGATGGEDDGYTVEEVPETF